MVLERFSTWIHVRLGAQIHDGFHARLRGGLYRLSDRGAAMSDNSVIYAYLRGQVQAAHDCIRAIAEARHAPVKLDAAIREAVALLSQDEKPTKDDLDDILG